jgi:hypothetical protein
MTEASPSVSDCGSRTFIAATAWCASTAASWISSRRKSELHNRLMAARAAPEQCAGKPESDLIVELAPVLERSSPSCSASPEVRALRSRHDALAPLYSVKRLFVQRRAAKKYGPDQAAAFDGDSLASRARPLLAASSPELRFAERVELWMKAEIEKSRCA